MTREEEIIEAAKKAEKGVGFSDIVKKAKEVNSAYGIGFLEGATWSDEHPRKGLVDIDKACEWLLKHTSCCSPELERFRKAMQDG